jgi:hypothetical protein
MRSGSGTPNPSISSGYPLTYRRVAAPGRGRIDAMASQETVNMVTYDVFKRIDQRIQSEIGPDGHDRSDGCVEDEQIDEMRDFDDSIQITVSHGFGQCSMWPCRCYIETTFGLGCLLHSLSQQCHQLSWIVS